MAAQPVDDSAAAPAGFSADAEAAARPGRAMMRRKKMPPLDPRRGPGALAGAAVAPDRKSVV